MLRNKYHTVQFSKAFSLVELLVIVSIIAILSIIGLTVYKEVRIQTSTVKLAGDLHAIEMAFRSRYVVTQSRSFPADTIYGIDSGASKCGTSNQNPRISRTDLLDPPGDTPPYLAQVPLNPITNKEYQYDYDPTDNDGSINDGANLRLYFCTPEEQAEAKEFLERLDKIVDNSNGPIIGKIRWYVNADVTSLIYHMEDPHTP